MKKFLLVLLSLALVLFFVFGAQSNAASAKNGDVKLKVFVHYPRGHGKPITVSNCTDTNTNSNHYELAGWSMPSSGVTYKINYGTKPKNLTSEQVLGAISNSFATWSAADSKQIFVNGGSTSVRTAKFDGINAVLFKGISGSAIAITYVWYYPSTGQLVEVDTAFNKNLKWSYTAYTGSNDCGGAGGAYDVQNIGTHEFGHWVGLDDLYDGAYKDLTMYGYGETTELKKDSLGLGDRNGALAVEP